ncbi:MAG: photosynthetic reaction center subunit H [Pseudomonadota bacterium]
MNTAALEYAQIVGRIDLALVSLYLFWAFFAGLIIYIQRENMREGYPLVDEAGNEAKNQGLFSVPDPKTFTMPGDRADVITPRPDEVERTVNLVPVANSAGTAFDPAGDPFADGVGAAAWCEREDVPEIDAHGHAKIQPMRNHEAFTVAMGSKDPRGLNVVTADNKVVGTVKDMWIDVPEQLIRYYEIDLGEAGTRLVPKDLSKIIGAGLKIKSLPSDLIANVPVTASDSQVTKLEEEKISAYYCGGYFFSMERSEPALG